MLATWRTRRPQGHRGQGGDARSVRRAAGCVRCQLHLCIRRLLQAVSGSAPRRLPRLRFWPRLLFMRELWMRLLRVREPPCLAGRCAAVPVPRLPAGVGSATKCNAGCRPGNGASFTPWVRIRVVPSCIQISCPQSLFPRTVQVPGLQQLQQQRSRQQSRQMQLQT